MSMAQAITVLGFRLKRLTASTFAMESNGMEYRIKYTKGEYRVSGGSVQWWTETLEDAVSDIADETEGWYD